MGATQLLQRPVVDTNVGESELIRKQLADIKEREARGELNSQGARLEKRALRNTCSHKNTEGDECKDCECILPPSPLLPRSIRN